MVAACVEGTYRCLSCPSGPWHIARRPSLQKARPAVGYKEYLCGGFQSDSVEQGCICVIYIHLELKQRKRSIRFYVFVELHLPLRVHRTFRIGILKSGSRLDTSLLCGCAPTIPQSAFVQAGGQDIWLYWCKSTNSDTSFCLGCSIRYWTGPVLCRTSHEISTSQTSAWTRGGNTIATCIC